MYYPEAGISAQCGRSSGIVKTSAIDRFEPNSGHRPRRQFLDGERAQRMSISELCFFGQPGDFLTARELVIRGTNFEIGRTVGRIAIERYGRRPADFACDPLFGSARRKYMRTHFPIHWERMRGVANILGVDPEDDSYDLTGMAYLTDLPMPPPACSAVYYPPATTSSGTGFLSRNYDFSIDSMAGFMRTPLPPDERDRVGPIMSQPYIMVWHPTDGGYATLAVHAFDLLSGTLEGINSTGLVVSILADHTAINDLGAKLERHPGPARAVGLNELAVMRLLLDTCSTAAQAKAALLSIKQYYSFAPLHYLIADRYGNSFVYEDSTGRNTQYVIDGGGRPQVLTNFQIHRFTSPIPPALEELNAENETYWRHRQLVERIEANAGRFTPAEMKTANGCVSVGAMMKLIGPDHPLCGVPSRTIWHSLYDQEASRVEISFYLGEALEPDGAYRERRSDYTTFAIDGN